MRYCQFNEEELLAEVLPEHGYFVEIGCLPDHKFSNTKHLHDNGWKGIWIDMNLHTPGIRQAKITADNVNKVLKRLNVPQDFDLLSLDIDGNDYYVFEALTFKPKIVVIEYNHYKDSGVMERNDDYEWKGDKTFGASKEAMLELAERKGYRLESFNESNLILCLKQ